MAVFGHGGRVVALAMAHDVEDWWHAGSRGGWGIMDEQ
jgi:hypothetical protein